jgi:hypothetical protein
MESRYPSTYNNYKVAHTNDVHTHIYQPQQKKPTQEKENPSHSNMGKTFTWSCEHKLHRDDLGDGPGVIYPFPCYVCTCHKALNQLHKTHGNLHAEPTQSMGLSPTPENTKRAKERGMEIDDFRDRQLEKIYRGYAQFVRTQSGEEALESLESSH